MGARYFLIADTVDQAARFRRAQAPKPSIPSRAGRPAPAIGPGTLTLGVNDTVAALLLLLVKSIYTLSTATPFFVSVPVGRANELPVPVVGPTKVNPVLLSSTV